MGNNKLKQELLGMPIGTATARLRKMLLFDFSKRLGLDSCYRCQKKIETLEEFSIEHTKSWQWDENPAEAFFDLSRIAFSHLVCNVSAPRESPKLHGTKWRYENGCRCAPCTNAHAAHIREWRYRTGRRKRISPPPPIFKRGAMI